MVKTRQNRYQNDHLSSSYLQLQSTSKVHSSNLMRNYECNDSDSSSYIQVKKRRAVDATPRKSTRNKTIDLQSSSSTVTTRRTRSETIKSEVMERAMNGYHDEDSKGDTGGYADGIRRSTRRRKTLYDTLNQSWILGTKIRDFPMLSERDNVRKRRCSGDDGSVEVSIDAYDDMYSRVKQQRRKRVRELYVIDKGKKSSMDSDDSAEEGDTEEDGGDVLSEQTRQDEGNRWDSKSSGEDTHEDGPHPKYYLRQKKPVINRFQMPIEPPRNRKVTSKSAFHTSPPHHRTRFHAFKSPAHKSPLVQRRRHATHNSSSSSGSSSSSSSEDERRFERRKAKSMARARNRCLPMNLTAADLSTGVLPDRLKAGHSLADVDPMNIDRTITFDSVGGLKKHIDSLKEMIIFPLLYPEVFEKFKITPPRGVLFFGPPGTGKTLVARALANECSQGERRISFFMRKGADCLSKWVGESERQLRILFDQAYLMRPSIIFFDEIDGLAPVRSSRQDQIHSSIVSTLLALMDGLDNRGEVVVIGATNRIDAIDPALRRPGRFDREFNFPLPSLQARRSILQIHTKEWVPKLSCSFLDEISEKTTGYCGADLKALCGEVALIALKRRYPQIYSSRQKLQLDVSSIQIELGDFFKAMLKLVPASQRSATSPGRMLSVQIKPLLQNALNKVLESLKLIFPVGITVKGHENLKVAPLQEASLLESEDNDSGDDVFAFETDQECNNANKNAAGNNVKQASQSNRYYRYQATSHRPRLLLTGKADQGQSTHLAPAILHSLEHFPVHKLDLPTLYAVTAKAPEESCAQVFIEARRTLPSILYLPHIGQWWETLSDTVRATFLTLLHDLEPAAPLFLLATSDCPYKELPKQVQCLFCNYTEVIEMRNPTKDERREFFSELIFCQIYMPPKQKHKSVAACEQLPVAPAPETRTLNAAELKILEEQEEATLRELRLFLREILYKLARDRRFAIFSKPVDVTEVPDYLDVVKQPMDLEAMLTKIDTHQYETVGQFLEDIDLICHNALEYNPDRDPSDKIIRHRACALRDAAHALIDSELDPEFEKICQEIVESRKRRGCSPSKFAPKNYHTIPVQSQQMKASSGPLTDSNSKEGNPIRFSRRLRGMSVGSPSHSEPENSKETPSVKISNSSTGEIVSRRRRSLWFGSRSRIIKKFHIEQSPETPERPFRVISEEQENIFPKKSTSTSSKQDSECCEQPLNRDSTDISNDSGNANPSSLSPPTEIEANNDSISGTSNEKMSRNVCGSRTEERDCVNKFSKVENCLYSVKTEDQISMVTPAEVNKSSPSITVSENSLNQDSQEVSEKLLERSPPRVPTQPLEVISQKVIVDEDYLNTLLDDLVCKTEGCSLERLERLYCTVQRCILHHRKEWDKCNLLKELDMQIKQVKKQTS